MQNAQNQRYVAQNVEQECLLLNFVVAQASKGKHRHLFISGTWFLKFFSKFLQNELVFNVACITKIFFELEGKLKQNFYYSSIIC